MTYSHVVGAAMALRIAGDLSDAAVLGTRTTAKVRAKVLGVTLGWAALNLAAHAADRRGGALTGADRLLAVVPARATVSR